MEKNIIIRYKSILNTFYCNNYNFINKADIWSIGTVFYEILFGRPPYTAGNMIDLLKNIKTKPLEINRNINNISLIAEDVLRRMLV
jgi:serine/threonine-protein kinase ULK2